MSGLRITGGLVDGYGIEDSILYSLSCNQCGAEHPVSVECDPEKRASWQMYWKRIADKFAEEFGWDPYW